MINMYKEWRQLTLSQFWGKKNIEGIMRAICEELQEVYEIQQQLRTLMDIDTQEGVNLDNIGDIVCLSREDAQKILKKDEAFEMTDKLYRSVLRYMIAMHGSSATYYDIVNGIKLIWNVDSVTYTEDRSRPATVLLKLPAATLDDADPAVDRILSVKPAGVAVYYTVQYKDQVDQDTLEQVRFQNLEMTTGFRFWNGLYLDGTWLLDGKYKLNGNVVPMTVDVSYGASAAKIENSVSGEVILKKNLWYLDGAEMLDGSRLINASITKEVL